MHGNPNIKFFKIVLAINTMFCNFNESLIHKAIILLPLFLNLVIGNFFNRCFASNIDCSYTTLLYSHIPNYTMFPITKLQWYPTAHSTLEKWYVTFVIFL